jgi:hypothetical protein
VTDETRRPWIKPPGLVILVCAILHITYGLMLWLKPDVACIASLYLVTYLIGGWAPSILILVGGLALMPRLIEMSRWRMQWYIWPQQTVMLLMAGSILYASWNGVYPDGTVKNGAFIFTDQCWAIYLAIAHVSASLRNLKYGPGYVIP